jgi:hypothetical protein
MPTTGTQRQPPAQSPTRQQLDDLDLLLKRMQELPVHEPPQETADQSSGPANPELRSDAPSPMPAPNFSLDISPIGTSPLQEAESVTEQSADPEPQFEFPRNEHPTAS